MLLGWEITNGALAHRALGLALGHGVSVLAALIDRFAASLSSDAVATPNVWVVFSLRLDEISEGFGEDSALISVQVSLPKILHALNQILVEAKHF